MPDATAAAKASAYLEKCLQEQNSSGGIIECQIFGLPVGLGDPVFEKLDANLAKAILSIGAVKGFEIGAGFGAATATGLTNNDAFCMENGHISKRTNYSGGTLGGMSDGSLLFSVQPSNRHRPLQQHSRPSTKTEKKLRSASKDDTIRLSFRVQWSLLRQ